MNKPNLNTILQIIALVFLLIIGDITLRSSSNWKIVKSEMQQAKENVKQSQDSLVATISRLEISKKEFETMKAQKDLIIHQRDSLILDYKRRNTRDLRSLQAIKDSIKRLNTQLTKDREIVNRLLGIE